MRNIAALINVVGEEMHVRELGYHFLDLGRNGFALCAPGGCGLEDCDAFVGDGAEVVGFGLEGGDLAWSFGHVGSGEVGVGWLSLGNWRFLYVMIY